MCFLWLLLVPNKSISVNQSIHVALVVGASLQCDISTLLLLQNIKILLIISFIISSVLKLKGNGHEEHYNYNICVLYIMYQGFNNHGVNIWRDQIFDP